MRGWSSSRAAFWRPTSPMDAEGLAASLQGTRSTAFRLETLQYYAGEDEDVDAFRRGLPRAQRSVVTSSYLRRLAIATLAGKRWERVHVVDSPLTDYVRYELAAYVESAAVGEDIRIGDRAVSPQLADLQQDFWLLDEAAPAAQALIMDYDGQGRFLGARRADDPGTLAWCRQARKIALRHSVPLNAYLASDRQHVA